MKKRYVQTLILLLAALLVSHNAKAQEPGTSTVSTGPTVRGSVYGGGNLAKVEGSVTVNMSAGTVANDVYGGGAKAETNTANTGNPVTAVNLRGGIVTGSVYGGGLGQQKVAAQAAVGNPGEENYQPAVAEQEAIPANVNGTVTVTVSRGTAYNVYGCNNLQGAPQKDVTVNIQDGTINNNVFGGGNQADAPGSIVVNVTGGTVKNDVYGGGALASTNTANWDATKNSNAGGWADETNTSAVKTTTVSLTGGTIYGDAYGGGLGRQESDTETAIEALVYGDVTVEVNGTKFNLSTEEYTDDDNTTVSAAMSGRVFGCNNQNGSPKGKVVVNVLQTVAGNVTRTESGDLESTDESKHKYEIAAVYGGGNEAAYVPTDLSTGKTEVNINGCGNTSIAQVYGGGNAASTPATQVTILGTYEIGEVFGGGNGKDKLKKGDDYWVKNGGANVGFYAYDADSEAYDTPEERQTRQYGTGRAQVNINGGRVHAVYGGSNTKGNVREVAVALLEEAQSNGSAVCDFKVDEAYGGGKSAPMDGRAELQLGCIPGVKRIYGGARAAKVNNDVVLTITNGEYDQVFGGNNEAGLIDGTITVNIEETGCRPIKIGELYGGGKLAAYTAPLRTLNAGDEEKQVYQGPTLNLKSFTSIGNVFGGGLGETAVVTGDVTVNVNQVKGDMAGASSWTGKKTGDADIPNQLGTIGNIYGGGSAADVVGDVCVNIGTLEKVLFETTPHRTDLTHDTDGYTVQGANITGNVYGGGLGANTTVTGNVVVTVGGEKKDGDNTVYFGEGVAIAGNVYGGSALGAVNMTKGSSGGTPTYTATSGKTTQLWLKKGTISGAVFGGGQGNENTQAKVYGKSVVNFYGDVIAEGLYGGCDLNGKMFNGTELNLMGGRIGDVFTQSNLPVMTPDIVFGGGLGAKTIVEGDVVVNVGKLTEPGTCTIYSNVYGGSKNGTVAATNVNLYGGTIWGDVFGGGYSTDANATAATDVTVNLNGTAFGITYDSYTEGEGTSAQTVSVPKTGRVFGCNNLQGSPKGSVTVNVIKTTDLDDSHKKTAEADLKKEGATHTYNVQAVYGGGNQAAYSPDLGTTENPKTPKVEVNVNGCSDVSVEYVYGGGNAAPMQTSTNVKILGAYEIGYTFGGGNGSDKLKSVSGTDVSWTENLGANVNGDASSVLIGGFIHNVFGGSNTKGTISGATSIDISESQSSCDLITENVYGAGKSADVEGDIDIRIGCLADSVKNVYGGAMAAKINGNVTLTVTSGILENVYGGNNESGGIGGKITVNIEEVDECKPIVIGNLYGGGNLAPYPGDLASLNTTPNIEVNVKSFTSIGNIYGGGRGADAVVTGNTVVNINEVLGRHAAEAREAKTLTINEKQVTIPAHAANEIGAIGNVYGGGDEAAVKGNTTINIANSKTVEMKYVDDDTATDVDEKQPAVLGAKITGNVYGGGNEADVTGNTFVHVCANKGDETDSEYQAVSDGSVGVHITGNVFGGGKGKADTYKCEKAMVGTDGDGVDHPDGGTTVIIGNGTVDGTVYGGGEIGRVEKNTVVMIGLGEGVTTGETATSAPVIKGNVFGAGKGLETHGYAALVRGNPTVTIQGKAKVLRSVYGGGEIASVARYDVVNGVPVALAQVKEGQHSGYCIVSVKGNAVIGPEGSLVMHHKDAGGNTEYGTDGLPLPPDDAGHVFAAGKGVLPENYTYADKDHRPKRMMAYDESKYTSANQADWEYSDESHKNVWEYFPNEEKYFEFIQTLALATQTSATIGGNAFVKGSVYGGSENGLVQYDTNVTIEDNCQIGCGKNTTGRHPDPVWGDSYTVPEGTDLECASWDYDGKTGAPYDPYAIYEKDGKYYYDAACTNYADGGAVIAKDGHTYYGNVFGGGSGSVPYFDTNLNESRYIKTAGWVKGNTHVTIKGGHILTNVYGGCEATNVDGTAYVTMTGGTLGVPRTLAQIDAHPVTCYLFGAGKGDQRVFFNKDTNVKDVEVSITGGRIYGSVFGGGEDGHVHRNVTMTIGDDNGNGPTIGTWGTSYVDGNVFGGGRGFGGDAYTAGNVAGSVTMQIKGGTMLGSIYGGGRLGSVGYGLFDAETNGQPTPGYGEMRADTDTEKGFTDGTSNFFTKGRGHIDITISGGTIGNTHEYIVPNATNIAAASISETDISKWTTDNEWKKWKTYHHISKTEFDNATGRLTHTKGGNVFAGGMGRQTQLDGTTPITAIDWTRLGAAKQTKLTIKGDAVIKSNVYGGGELGAVISASGNTSEGGTTEIDIQGGTIGQLVGTGTAQYTFGSVYGGGMGSENDTSTEEKIGGRVAGSTKITMSAGEVKASVYGGGELAIVQGSHTTSDSKTVGTEINIIGGSIGYNQDGFGGATMGNVYGGGKGSLDTKQAGLIKTNTLIKISGGNIYHNIYGGGAYGSVGTFNYATPAGSTQPSSTPSGCTAGTGTAWINITGGTLGINGHENGMVFGSSRGDVAIPDASGEDPNNKLAWVDNTHVTIGASSGTNSTPWIKGSVYGSGENGHVLHDTYVAIHDGKIGIEAADGISFTSNGKTYTGAEYGSRGNVYGGGCGTDTYAVTEGTGTEAVTKHYFNRSSGIVRGNATVTMDGGHVVRNVYGGGAMGSVGLFTRKSDGTAPHIPGVVESCATNTGLCTVTISGGTVGPKNDAMSDDVGNVFGASRGEVHDASLYPNLDRMVFVDNTVLFISNAATVKGSAYGGSEAGHVLTATQVNMSGGTVGRNVYGGGNLGDVGLYTTDAGDSNIYAEGKGVCHVSITGGILGPENNTNSKIGNVFGAGKGEGTTFTCEKAMVNTTTVSIEGGTVNGNVYGGGEVGRVESNTTVTVGSATGTGSLVVKGSVFGAGAGLETHGYSALVRGNTAVTVQGNAHVEKNVYGGGETASVGRYGLDAEKMPSILLGGGECAVTIGGNATIGVAGNDATGNVFGACKGVTPHFDKANNDKSLRSRRMTMYDAAEFPEADKGTTWEYYEAGSPYVWEYYQDETSYTKYLETLALATRPTVIIKEDATVYGSVYGGGEMGITKGTVVVNIQGGTIAKDVYGGGALANTNTTKLVGEFDNGIPRKDTEGNYVTTEVHPTTTVNLTGGSFRDAYGGGLGQLASGTQKAIPAEVGGDVTVTLDGSTVNGSIFGANNINGTPLGHVLVHVKQTIPRDGPTFDVDAVFGGGNNADYVPTDTKQYSEVIIEGCNVTSINQVYGGGNAAATPGTSILVKGTKIIHELFGGGNGERGAAYAANVGYHFDGTNRTDYARGDGKALVQLMAGKIDFVYGGSNSNGDIRGGSTTSNIPITGTSPECCSDLQVGRIFGGGKNADMASGSDIVIECQTSSSWIEEIYAGAENANVGGNVRLTITSGKFGRVFGGNKSGGRLNGSITVNIEESPSCGIPVIIGELYAGGNKAPYSIYGYDDGGTMLTSGVAKHASPVVNVRAFTSIGNIFGGGYGEDAVMYGSPTININEVEVDHTDKSNAEFQGNLYRGETKTIVVDPGETPYDVVLYPHEDGKMGVIGNVYGGGNAAKVYGDTNVNIGTKTTDVFHTPLKKTVHNSQTGVDEEVATDEADRTHTVKGADIRGNVYGGGNEAEVTGDTNVKIGITATP